MAYALATPQISSRSLGPQPVPVRRAGGDGVGRRHEGIRAVVDVEQRPLGALEDDVPAAVDHVPGQPRGVRDVLLDPVPVREVVLGHGLEVELRRLRVGAEREALRLHRGHDLLLEDLLVEQVLHPDPQPRRLVGVRRADAAPGRPDLELAELRLPGVVEEHVVGHDQVRVGADAQARQVDALGPQAVELVRQDLGIDHHAVADRAALARVEDPRRDQVELPHDAVADDRVAGVVAALEADHEIRVLCDEVGDLALALVAPLGADDHDPGHIACSLRGPPGRARRGSPYAGGSSSQAGAGAGSGTSGSS